MNPEQENIIRDLVGKYLNKQPMMNFPSTLSDDEREHVIDMGTQMLAVKWGLQNHCCRFVRSMLDNKLMETYGEADEVNLRFIRFYVLLNYNISAPSSLF